MNIKRFKIAISLILALVLAFNMAIPAFADVTSQEVTGKSGTKVTVRFVYENIRGLEVTNFTFSDPDMVASVEDLEVTGFSVVSYDAKTRHLMAFNMNTNVVKRSVVTLTFTLAKTTEAKTFDIELDYILAVEDSEKNIIEKTGTDKVTVNVIADPVDIGELQELIQIAESKKKDNYTAESWAKLEEALAEAKNAVKSNNQAIINSAAKKLGEALDGLVSLKIDYTELEKQIAAAATLNKADYTEESWAKLEAALNDAKEALKSKDQDVIDAAAEALEKAISSLEKKGSSATRVDLTQLRATIAEAESLKEEEYTPDTWANMQAVLSIAKSHLHPNYGQEFIDQLTQDLRLAIDALVRVDAPVTVDYTMLLAKIEAAKALNQDEYTDETWAVLQGALRDGRTALESKDQAVVDAAAKAIGDAIAGLELRPDAPKVDYTELNKAIEAAEKLNEENYTAASWAVLKSALKAAKDALTVADQYVVDNATEELNDAMAALEENPDNPPPTIDYTKLTEQIARAEALDGSKYTEASWAALETALAAAKSALTSKVQSVVDGAASELESAINGLEEKTVTPNPPSSSEVNYAELNAQIGIAKALLERNYSPESWRKMTEALAVAEAALSSNEQAFVDNAAANLKAAIEALVVVDENEAPNMLWLVIVLASVIVLMIAAAVIVIIVKKKRERDLTPLVDYDIEDDNN